MPDQLTVEKKLVDGKFHVIASILDPVAIPEACFVYENSGTTDLGCYIGVMDLEESRRFDIWDGTVVPKFGNKYLRHTEMKNSASSEDIADVMISHLVDSVKRLKLEIDTASPDVTVYNI